MSQVLYDSDYALLTFFKSKKILELLWKCSSPQTEYQKVFSKAVEIADTNKVDYFLSDLREGGAVTLDNFRWLKSYVIPKAKELGVKKVGLILQEDLFKKIYADSIRDSLSKYNISIAFFEQYEEALQWFES